MGTSVGNQQFLVHLSLQPLGKYGDENRQTTNFSQENSGDRTSNLKLTTETDNEYCLLVALGRDFPDRFPGTSVTSLKSLCHPCPEYSPLYKLPSGLKRGYPEISRFSIIFSKYSQVAMDCGYAIFTPINWGLILPRFWHCCLGFPRWHGTRKSRKPFVFVDKLRIPDFRVGSQGICTRFLNDFDQSINS